MTKTTFEWDANKDIINQKKHGISFSSAQHAFLDPHRIIAEDLKHSAREKRYFCFGKAEGEIITVRFTYRENRIRIIGAGYWKNGRIEYEEKNKI
jgi:uncharacterized DUF497 family protein